MSPKKPTKRHHHDGDRDVDFRGIAILTGCLVSVLLVAPIIYRLTIKLIETDHEHLVNSNLLAFIVTSASCAGLLLLTNVYLKCFSNYLAQDRHQLRASHKPAFIVKLLALLAPADSRLQPSGSPQQTGDGRRSPFYSDEHSNADQDSFGKRKIDPKYFKPKFIIHELMTFWGTTCTVITWGSFYIIGGTVVISERLAQKIKAKSGRSPSKEGTHHGSTSSGSASARGTGQADFSFSSAFGTSQPSSAPPEANLRKPPFQRISSWTRRSILSIRKKFSRTVRNNHPQLTTGSANDSSSNIFFFGGATTSG